MLQQWKGFVSGKWTEDINLRDFIQLNYTPYEGNGSFLASATEVTHWTLDKQQNDSRIPIANFFSIISLIMSLIKPQSVE